MSSKWYLPLIITLVGTATTISALAAPIPTESVELWNKPDGTQGMTLSAEQIKAGQTKITATNTSTNEDHELLIVKTDLDPMQFPRTSDQSKVDEGKLKGLRKLAISRQANQGARHSSWRQDVMCCSAMKWATSTPVCTRC